MERYALAARTWSKGDTVESLMKGILEDLQLLTSNRVAELPTQTSVAAVIQQRFCPRCQTVFFSQADVENNSLTLNRHSPIHYP